MDCAAFSVPVAHCASPLSGPIPAAAKTRTHRNSRIHFTIFNRSTHTVAWRSCMRSKRSANLSVRQLTSFIKLPFLCHPGPLVDVQPPSSICTVGASAAVVRLRDGSHHVLLEMLMVWQIEPSSRPESSQCIDVHPKFSSRTSCFEAAPNWSPISKRCTEHEGWQGPKVRIAKNDQLLQSVSGREQVA
jgi:hypothetical protein